MEKKFIWCLFSIANEYNQPNYNLECFWFTKPDAFKLKTVCQCTEEEAMILFDHTLRVDQVHYSLQEVEEGVILK